MTREERDVEILREILRELDDGTRTKSELRALAEQRFWERIEQEETCPA